MAELKKLNLGCGERRVEGAIGVDRVKTDAVDVVHDLMKFPYPFTDGEFDEVYLYDVIEHLPDVESVMRECHRVLKPGGRVILTVVYWNHKYAWSDYQHVRGFTEHSFEYFVHDGRPLRNYYTDFKFSGMSIEYIYPVRFRRWKIVHGLLRRLSHYLCNMVQGMKIELTK